MFQNRLVKLAVGSLLGGGVILGNLVAAQSIEEAYAQPSSAPPIKEINGKNYELVWSEECSQRNKLDDAWNLTRSGQWDTPPENGAMRYLNKMSTKTSGGYDLDSNIQVIWGQCTLRAIKDDTLGSKYMASSGGFSTKKAWKYGHFEARMRFPTAEGTWPALWMMPEENPYGWPRDGEIDWIEYPRSASSKQNQTNLHTSSVDSKRGLHDSSTIGFYTHNQDLGAQWHVWSMDWDEDGFVFSVDGKVYKRILKKSPYGSKGNAGMVNGNYRWFSSWYMDDENRPINQVGKVSDQKHEDPADSMAPFDKKFKLIFNLGMKKSPDWAGAKPQNIDWPQAKVDLDYVRVYQTAEQKEKQDDLFIKYDTGEKAKPPVQTSIKVGEKYGNKLPVLVSKDGTQIARHWYTRPNLDSYAEVTADTVAKTDVVLFPKWETRPSYSVSFDRGGHGADTAVKSVRHGESVELPVLSESGWRFDGWFEDSGFSRKVSSPFSPSGDVKLFAKWTDQQKHPVLITPNPPVSLRSSFKDISKGSPFRDEISWMHDKKLSTGWSDGTYRPYQAIDRNAMIAFIYRLAGSPKVDLSTKPVFKDVKPGDPFYKEIQWAGTKGISKGWSDGTFRPYLKIERSAMAAFMYRLVHDKTLRPKTISGTLADLSMIEQKVHFTDTANNQFKREIEWCAKAGISKGWSDGTFRPYLKIERNAVAAFIYRLSNNHVEWK